MFKEQSDSFKTTTADPMNKMMDDLRTRIEDLSKQGASDREALDARMHEVANTTSELMKNSKALTEVLKNSQRRGRHAEISLERVFEMSNLTRGVHYDTQSFSEDGKPDFVIKLSGDRAFIVDSKAPLDSLWNAFDTDDEAAKSDFLNKHASAVKSHVSSLSKKQYWDTPQSSLDYVIMVMPEYALLPALDRDSELIEYALTKRVVLVTPSTLMILLRAVDLIWKQSNMIDTVKEISAISAELHSRLNKFAEHYNRAGKGLESAVRYYNDGVGSWTRRILPAADKLAKAGAVESMKELDLINNSPNQLPTDDDVHSNPDETGDSEHKSEH